MSYMLKIQSLVKEKSDLMNEEGIKFKLSLGFKEEAQENGNTILGMDIRRIMRSKRLLLC